jgi:hypothetical protein
MLAPSRYDGHWMLLSEDKSIGQRRWIRRDDDNPNKWHVKTESWAPSLIAESNEEVRNANAGQRFGSGRTVARIPMSVLYGPLLEPFRAKDEPYMRKFLNASENKWMRTFDGKL